MIAMHGYKMRKTGVTKCNAEKKKEAENNCMRTLIIWNDRKNIK